MPEAEKSGFFSKIKNLFQLSPEEQERHNLAMQISAADAYYKAIVPVLNREGHYSDFRDDIRRELVRRLSEKWLNEHATQSHPHIDELEVEKDWVIRSNLFDQHEKHGRLTLRQLGTWIDTQKHNFGIQ